MKTKVHEYAYSEYENYITGKELLEMSGAKIWAETESETIYTMDDAIYIIEWRKYKQSKRAQAPVCNGWRRCTDNDTPGRK